MKHAELPEEMTRRQFLYRSRAAAALGLGGAAVWSSTRSHAADGGRNPFAYDVRKYRQTDPKLVAYEVAARFRSPLSEPRRMAIGPEDRLYIAAGKAVAVLSREGGPLGELGFPAMVRSLAVAADGLVYAGLKDHVEVYEAKGRRVAQWEAPKGKPFLTGLAVSAREVFVADAGNRVVWRCDRSGQVLGRIGEKNQERGVPGLILPSPFLDVEMGADGLLRVNNPGRHRVETYTVEGDLELAWGKPSMGIEGFCGCCNPVNLALLADGRVVTFEKGLPRVKVYGADGTLESVVAGPEAFGDTGGEEAITDPDEHAYGGLDGVVDSAGRVYVLDLLSAEVQVFRRKGAA